MTDETIQHCRRAAPGSLLHLPADRGARRAGGDGNAGHQYPAAFAAADGGIAECVQRRPSPWRSRCSSRCSRIGQLAVGPISDRYGRRWPVLAGFPVFIAGSIWCGLAEDLPSLLTGRVIQAAGACATSVLSRAIARDLFSRRGAGRAMALIMIAMAAAPGFSPLLGGALDHSFGWRSEFAFVGTFAAIGRHRL